MKIFKALFGLLKFIAYIFLFLGGMATMLVGLLALVSEPGTLFGPNANTVFAAIMLVPTGLASMLYLADKLFNAAYRNLYDWELFEEKKYLTKTDFNLLLGIPYETNIVCNIYRRRRNGIYEYKIENV